MMMVMMMMMMINDNDDEEEEEDENCVDLIMMMMMQGDSGGPLVSCGRNGNCGTSAGQNYDLIGINNTYLIFVIFSPHTQSLV